MKISELKVGAPRGSQKDARLSPGTDEPSKYMRGGEWEAYREPQGIGSKAGQSVTKGSAMVTKKKKKESVELSPQARQLFEEFTVPNLDTAYWFWANPATDGIFEIPAGSSHTWEALKPVDKGGKIGLDPRQFGYDRIEDVPQDDGQVLMGAMEQGWVRGGWVGGGHIVLQAHDIEVALDALKAFKDGGVPVDRAELGGMTDGTTMVLDPEQIKTFLGEIDGTSPIQTGGAGTSNDIVTRDVELQALGFDQETPPNAKAPLKQTKAKVDKLNTDTRPVREAIHRPMVKDFTADYEIRDDRDAETIGVAKVRRGLIEVLAARDDVQEDFNGHIMSKLLSMIVNDADSSNANLSIELAFSDDLQHKRFLERFGFRETANGVMKRNAGAIRPPSVVTARL